MPCRPSSPQLADVGVAAVLHPAVGVVDEAVKTVRAAHRHGMGYGLPEGVERLRGAKRRRDLVAYDLVRVGIGDQVQVARATAFEWYVGYVGHPQLVRGGGREAAHEVLPLVVAVGRGRASVRGRRQSRASATACGSLCPGPPSVWPPHSPICCARSKRASRRRPATGSRTGGCGQTDGTRTRLPRRVR